MTDDSLAAIGERLLAEIASQWGRGVGSSSHYDSSVSSEHPNATAYRRTADAFRSGDGAELASLIAEDVVWHVPGCHAMTGDIHGRTALLAWLGELRVKGSGSWNLTYSAAISTFAL
jgi:hypothetical protein